MKIDCLPIDERIKEILKRQGIVELYPPQAEALPYVLEGKNVVLSVPTAAGKSLVAYISVLQSALRGEKSIYIVPLRALAREKYEDLLEFEEIGVRIGISTGDLDEKGGYLSKYDIVVCTSEKADSLLRHKAEWMNDVKIVVADEIHLINDGSRGPTLEVNLARFMLMKPVQIIALSATIKNAYKIAEWLDAVLIESDWRPVPLKEGILMGKSIDFLNDGIKKLEKSGIEGLVEDVLSQNGQALIFVNTRRSAQSSALKLAEITEKYVEKKAEEISHKILRDESINIISKKLASCVERGIAFHHAGLSSSHRREIERGFKKGIIKCIVATPTLAAGVNTPARRVIIKNLWRYSEMEGYMVPIPVMEIKQMMGRAGRPGYDEEGEAVLVARNKIEKERILKEYLLSDVEPVYSKLASESALRMHILSLIATEFAVYWEEIINFFKKTFYAHQLGIVPEEKIWEIIDFLERNDFIESYGERWKSTLFGHKTAELYLDPLSALKMRTALEGKMGNNFSYLHAVCSTPDMKCLFLTTKDNWIEEKIKEEKFLFDVPSPFDMEYEWFMAEVKTASLLEDWIEEKKEDYIITKYQVGPGDIHNKVEKAEWLIYSMQELARIFNFSAVPILSKLKMRIKYGCKEELLNLVQLRGIGRVRARILYKNGFKSISILRKASIETLAQLPGIGINIAKQIKEQVK
ncbi:MAG TPA: DEAD/DEAH box helicase [Thermoplasmatales archaeon]|nr:DEAD/DEAH box helicase [Thermoplasmatales archaeon]